MQRSNELITVLVKAMSIILRTEICQLLYKDARPKMHAYLIVFKIT